MTKAIMGQKRRTIWRNVVFTKGRPASSARSLALAATDPAMSPIRTAIK